MKYNKLGLLTACGTLFVAVQGSHAQTAQLMLDDPSTLGVDKLIVDNGPGDMDLTLGSVVFIGSVGSFSVNVSTGTTSPVLPGPYPHLDLNSVDIAAGAGSLTIGFTDINQSASILGMHTQVGGTMSGGVLGVTFNTYLDASNVPFGQATPMGTLSFNTSPFAGAVNTPASPGGLYSASLFATIAARGEGTTSFDLEFKPVPDAGSTAALLGSGVAGLLAISRRKR